MSSRWGFEEGDEEFDARTSQPSESSDDAEEALTGRDPDEVVAITVTDAADVVSVKLDPGWRRSVDPRGLHTSVLAAMNAATVRAVGKQAAQIDLSSAETAATDRFRSTPEPSEDAAPITKEYAFRLLDEVSADLDRFIRQASAIAEQVITSESAGGHVSVSGMRRQVSDVSIDARWVHAARDSEIESELRDALTGFAAQSSPGELVQGPQSSAINELMSLVANPQAMVRRINQPRS